MRDILAAVADHLGSGAEVEMVLTGGAYMALLGKRAMSLDIDSPVPFDSEVSAAVAAALNQLGYPADTLNSNAAMFTSAADLQTGRIELFRRGRLVVYGPSADTMLLLKLRASRPARDVHDIVALFPETTFVSGQDVVDRYWQAFPEEPEDEFLAEYVERLARSAGIGWTGR